MSHDDIANNPGDYPVYSSQTANDGVMGTIGTFDFDGSYLTWTTDGAKAGTVFARTGRFSCTNVCGTLKPRSQCDLGFFEFVLNRATHWYVRHDINPKLMNEVMASIRVPVPPMDEQIRIGGLLRGIYDHWQSVLKVMGESISLLDERRQAVLTAAVTGDIEILGAAV
jgi:type I restriction enzyme S subunit